MPNDKQVFDRAPAPIREASVFDPSRPGIYTDPFNQQEGREAGLSKSRAKNRYRYIGRNKGNKSGK